MNERISPYVQNNQIKWGLFLQDLKKLTRFQSIDANNNMNGFHRYPSNNNVLLLAYSLCAMPQNNMKNIDDDYAKKLEKASRTSGSFFLREHIPLRDSEREFIFHNCRKGISLEELIQSLERSPKFALDLSFDLLWHG